MNTDIKNSEITERELWVCLIASRSEKFGLPLTKIAAILENVFSEEEISIMFNYLMK